MKIEPQTTFKRILKSRGIKLQDVVIEELAQAAADVYAHPTEPGWCCGCEADIAFAESWLRETKPELFK